MSLLEKRARYSLALSVLNKFRHYLQGRENSELSEKDSSVLLESLELRTKEKLSKAVLYNFQGYADKEQAIAVQLSGAFDTVLKDLKNDEATTDIENIRKILKGEVNSSTSKIFQKSNELVTKTIENLINHSEPKAKSLITPKVF